MLGQRHRRWANIKSKLGRRLVSSGTMLAQLRVCVCHGKPWAGRLGHKSRPITRVLFCNLADWRGGNKGNYFSLRHVSAASNSSCPLAKAGVYSPIIELFQGHWRRGQPVVCSEAFPAKDVIYQTEAAVCAHTSDHVMKLLVSRFSNLTWLCVHD